jgi:hypothetical protein
LNAPVSLKDKLAGAFYFPDICIIKKITWEREIKSLRKVKYSKDPLARAGHAMKKRWL